MATRTDRFLKAAVRAARRAKQWADRLLEETQKQAESDDRRRRLKQTLTKTGRVLQAAGRAALVAAVAAGIVAARADRRRQNLPRGR
jgi:hypothetical protein